MYAVADYVLRRWVRNLVVVAAGFLVASCGQSEPESQGTPTDVRRLTEAQYRNIIADVFGTGIVVAGRFDKPVRTDGLLAVGERQATVTAGGMRQFDEMARSIAGQVVNDSNRRFLVPCELKPGMDFDRTCATAFIATYGRLLFRRPLTDAEISTRIGLMRETAQLLGQFRDGLAAGLASLLSAPQFLFVKEATEQVPSGPQHTRLDAYSIATRLSFFLWNTTPDHELLAAAENGALQTRKGLDAQVTRLMASPRLEDGVRAFFSDMLEFEAFEFLEKDTIIYPAFGIDVARDAKEQTLRTITDHIIGSDQDYRDLFTTRKTFMTRALGQVYRVRVEAPPGVWQPYEFSAEDSRIGLQTQLGFLALHSHPGRSSPTLRGKALRSTLLCQGVPAPPPDVDFTEFNDPKSPNKTARQRLTAHATNPACAGCHRITDPIGLALENFDGAGQFRTSEEGELIDTSGDLDGMAFDTALGIGHALRENPAVPSCLVNRLATYARGHTSPPNDRWTTYLEEDFRTSDYRVKALLRRIATSKGFIAVAAPPQDPPAASDAATSN